MIARKRHQRNGVAWFSYSAKCSKREGLFRGRRPEITTICGENVGET
jgi:hypothetical protein